MENNQINKSKFFAQYYGQQVLCYKGETSSHKYMIVSDNGKTLGLPQQFLELTPLHLISDEDAKKLPNRQYDGFTKMYENKEEFLTSLEIMRFLTQEETDILRSLGYAVNFQDLSVEEQVSRGWVVLKTKT